jgi:hypothetical protein
VRLTLYVAFGVHAHAGPAVAAESHKWVEVLDTVAMPSNAASDVRMTFFKVSMNTQCVLLHADNAHALMPRSIAVLAVARACSLCRT